MAVTLEMDLDLKTVERSHFGFIELLSDIGGIASILSASIVTTLAVWHGNRYTEATLIRQLMSINRLRAEYDEMKGIGFFERRK